MPSDINSFALNLELALQDSATEALRKVSTYTTTLETKINDINVRMTNFGNSTEKAGGTLQKMFSKASQSVKSFAGTQEAKLKTEMKSAKLAGDEAKQTEKLSSMEHKDDITRSRMEKDYQKLVTNFSKKSVKNYKGEILDRKTMQKLSKDQIKDYNKIQKMRTYLGKEDVAEVKAKTKATDLGNDGEKSASMFGKMLNRVKSSVAEVSTTLHSTFSGVFHSVFGEIAAATSLVGLFEAGVLRATDREEKFHTINFRQLGTMEQLNNVMIELGTSGVRVLTSELTDATIALRQVGAGAREIDMLRTSVAAMGRVTGVDVKVLSKFAHNLTAVTKNEMLAGQQMVKMTRAGRDFGLEGQDMAMIMDQVSAASLYLGAAGSDNIVGYSDALMRGVASAKQLGLSAQDAASLLRKMEDPLNTVAILGPKSLNWSFEKRSAEMGKWADHAVKMLEQAEKTGHGFIMRQKLAARLGVEAGDVMKTLKLAQGQANKALEPKAEPKPETKKELENQLAEFLKTAEGVARLTDMSVDKTMANLQKKLEPVRMMFKELLELFVSDPMYPALAAIGVIGVAVGGLLITAFMGIVGVVGLVAAGVFSLGGMFLSAIGTVAFGALKLLISGVGFVGESLFGLAKTGVSVFGSIVQAAGGVLPLLSTMGQAALLVGAAYAGWKIGKWIDGVTGLGDSIDRVNRGHGTWWDYIKTYGTGIGIVSTFYKQYLDWSNKAADAKEREIRMNREEAKSHWVTEKLAMQEAYRKATIAGDKAQMNALDKQLQQMLVDEQKEYERSEQYKTIIAANAAKDRATQQENAVAKAVETAPDMSLTDKLGINSDDISKAMEKLKSLVPSGDQVRESFGKVKDYIEPVFSKGVTFLKDEFGQLTAKLQNSNTYAPILATIETSFTKIKENVGPVFEKGSKLLTDAIQQYGPLVKGMLTDALQKGGQTLQNLIPVRPDSIVTVKTDENTARPTTRRDEEQATSVATLTEVVRAQFEIMKKIYDKIDPETAKKIRELLERTLPEMTTGSSGLASSANQWMN